MLSMGAALSLMKIQRRVTEKIQRGLSQGTSLRGHHAADSSDSELELSTVRHQPEGLEQLQAVTKFTKKELQSLYRGFKNECPSGLVDEETFKLIYSQFFPQGEEMLAIMKSIYDMMGRYTYPMLRDDAPIEHVERFFQKMDRNHDGVVTIDEFLETCQKDENIMRSMQLFENVI
ncbi:hypothetical protein GDO81_009283 [Engystomops pustulosus]|uniref:EF-hand domain-containing protein n=1 Tax=Engystomops pustulosus TaxID=76066 RepID=A0AAV7BQN5_ENGPU|nr:hypothetical protein GDO81_009283 [Engystomops pustulosus]